MQKLPVAPDLERLRTLDPPVHVLGTDRLWHRIYRRGGAYPTTWNAFRHFGPTDARFDHHLPGADGASHLQERGILYVAGDGPTCIAEVFQSNREVDAYDRHPWLVSFRFQAPLALLDLTDAFAVRAGASMKLASGPHTFAQNWARGFYESYRHIDGVCFLSSMTNRPAMALFERALAKAPFPASPLFHRSLADPLMAIPVEEACNDIGYQLSPNTSF